MPGPDEINADMLSFWNGTGGHTWVTRQEHTDITLTPVTDALLAFAAPRTGERVVDMVITDLAVFTIDKQGNDGMALIELADGVTLEDVKAKTEADFRVALKNT